ncbi:outer membrane beta-barrel family protein [Pedobacter sp. P351]|uniref:outer membrane beta-barrel family protein n=1 Tax=Pedobacter superstes TaxID=3133441 RepID=UPI0030B72188
MKSLSLLIISFFLANSMMAQMPVAGTPAITGRISGTIIDSVTQKPLDYVSVSLSRASSAKSTNGALTDSKGVFKIDNVSAGSYKLSLSFMGYQTKIINSVITTPGKPDLNLGRIVLSASATALKEVQVTGQAALIENRVDKVVYNAEKDATVSGGNAGDVLRKVPMVSVDQDGNVSLRGSQNIKVLINGKPSGAMASNVGDAMKMLPADQIKSVEVITSPSAKYDAEGSGGIINIITKRKEMSGVSGSLSGGVGTRQNNGNANLNVNKNRLSLTGNFGGNLTWPQESLTSIEREDLVSSSSQQGTSEAMRYGFTTSGNVSYDINSSNSISSGIRFNQGGFKTDGSSVNTSTSGTGTLINTILNDNKNQFTGFDWSGDYNHKYKKAGHEISIAGQWTRMQAESDFENYYSSEITKDQIGNNDGINNEYTAQADYSLPINEKVKLELGAKSIFRRINSESVFNKRNSTGDFVNNTDLSNIYGYEQDVYSGYSVLTLQLKKGWGLQAGGRMESTLIRGDVDNTIQGLKPFSANYDNFIPSFSVSKTIKTNSLRLSYSKRIQRPSLQYLNPFRNISNDIFHSVGNPELEPEISQSVEFNFSTYIKSSVINASLYFRHTEDVIENFLTAEDYTYPNGETKRVSLSTFQNIGQNNSIGGSVFSQVTLVKGVTMRGNLNIYTYSPNVSISYTSAASNGDKTYLMYNAFLGGSVTLAKGFLAETFAIVNAPRRTSQGRNPSFNMWQFSLNKEVLKKKGKIGINVVDPFNERKNFKSSFVGGNGLTQNSNFSIPFRSVGVNFSWQFGKMNFTPQQPKKKRGVNNDDLKQDGGNTQGM